MTLKRIRYSVSFALAVMVTLYFASFVGGLGAQESKPVAEDAKGAAGKDTDDASDAEANDADASDDGKPARAKRRNARPVFSGPDASAIFGKITEGLWGKHNMEKPDNDVRLAPSYLSALELLDDAGFKAAIDVLDVPSTDPYAAAWAKGADGLKAFLAALDADKVHIMSFSCAVRYSLLKHKARGDVRSVVQKATGLSNEDFEFWMNKPGWGEHFSKDELALAVRAQLSGSLEDRSGVKLLKVWGTPFERGVAHGRLLAKEIVALVRAASTDMVYLGAAQRTYDEIREIQHISFVLPPDFVSELRGMLAGIKAALPNLDDRKLGDRDIDLTDLKALNTVADWVRFGCSSFTAFAATAGKTGPFTARNLDYIMDVSARITAVPLMIANLPGDPTASVGGPAKGWLSASWPGLIGLYSAQREDGLTLLIHDSNGIGKRRIGFYPRAIAAREVLLRADANDLIPSMEKLFRELDCFSGSNFHMSAPNKDGTDLVAAVFEYCGRESIDHGVTVRRPGDAEKAAKYMIVTNHFCKRSPSRPAADDSTRRFTSLETALEECAAGKKELTLDYARELLGSVCASNQFVMTVHTVYSFPLKREFHVAYADKRTPSTKSDAVVFTADDLTRPSVATDTTGEKK